MIVKKMNAREVVIFFHSKGSNSLNMVNNDSFHYVVGKLRNYTIVNVIDVASSNELFKCLRRRGQSVPFMNIHVDEEVLTVVGVTNVLVTLMGMLKRAVGTEEQLFETLNIVDERLRHQVFYTTAEKLVQLDKVFLRTTKCMSHTSCAQMPRSSNGPNVERYYTSHDIINELHKARDYNQLIMLVCPNKAFMENLINEHFPGEPAPPQPSAAMMLASSMSAAASSSSSPSSSSTKQQQQQQQQPSMYSV